MNTTLWALGDAAEDQIRGFVGDDFEPAGSGMGFRLECNPAMSSLLTSDGVRRAIDETEAAGYDELMLVPTSADLR